MLPTRSFVLLFLATLIVPTAAADVSIAGGAVIVHEGESPGATIAGVGSARMVEPSCYEGLTCAFIVGELVGEPYFVFVGGGPSNCYPQPSDCAVVFAVRNDTGAIVQVVRHEDLVSVCAFGGQGAEIAGACYAAVFSVDADPTSPGACVGAGEQTYSYTERPEETCDGLYVSSDPPCVERQSDGFDVICQT